jgi:hypothetical protein
MAGMDSKSREVSLNPVEDVEIFKLGVGLHNIIGPLTGREKEKSVKFIKRSAEKDSSKSLDNESRSSEVDWSIVCSQTPVPASEMKTMSVKKYGWSGKTRINPSVMGEIQAWTRWIKKNPSFHLQKPSPPQAIITTDAALHGWEATLTFTKHSNFFNRLPPTRINNTSFRQYQSQPAAEPVIAYGQWTKTMSTRTSNRRELVAIHMALRKFLPLLKEKGVSIVQVYSDNTMVVYNINKKAVLKSLAPSLRKLLVYAQNQGITLQALHIPGVENKVMDSLSRLETSRDYMVQRRFFNRMIWKFRFLLTIDLFVNK